MKRKFLYYTRYELLNNLYNGYSFFFGAVFPTLLAILLSYSIFRDVPESIRSQGVTTLFLGMGTIVPMATVFLGYAASYANELEKDIPSRLQLFGLSGRFQLAGKLLANAVFLTVCFLFYMVPTVLVTRISRPASWMAAAAYILILYIFAAALLMLAHAISNLIRKFGPTYGVVMGIYFLMMILGGSMGVEVDTFPLWLKQVAGLLPNRYLAGGFVDFWVGNTYNMAPLIQSLLTFTAISTVVLVLSFKLRGRE